MRVKVECVNVKKCMRMVQEGGKEGKEGRSSLKLWKLCKFGEFDVTFMYVV